jgi:hypothetical protein
VNKKLTGTARYASINALKGCEQSRRDDLEAIGYVLMYFLRGSLPWQGLHVNKGEDRYKKILIKKKETSSEELCKNFPEEFKDFVEYTRNLEYTEQPDYDRLKSSFFNLVTKKMGELFDFRYDWTTESDMKKRKENDIIDLAPSTNYPVSEKKSTQKEMSVNSKKVIQQPVNSEKEGNNIIIDGQKENDNNFQSKCCIIF